MASLNTNSGSHLYLENFLSNIKSFLATEKKKRNCTHLYPSTFRKAENELKKVFLCFRRIKCLPRCRNLCYRLHFDENSLLIFLVHGYLSQKSFALHLPLLRWFKHRSYFQNLRLKDLWSVFLWSSVSCVHTVFDLFRSVLCVYNITIIFYWLYSNGIRRTYTFVGYKKK